MTEKLLMEGGMLTMLKNLFSKRLFIVIAAISITSLLTYLTFFSALGLKLYDEKEKITFASQYSMKTAIVTEKGNVYINGEKDDADAKVLGIKNFKRFNNLYNSFRETDFVCIYDKGDASKVMLSSQGGAIITKENILYLFGSFETKYLTPLKFADNAKSAFPVNDRIYVLKTDGVFGYYLISNPNVFVTLFKSVVDFYVMEKSEEIIILTDSGELFVAKYNELNDFKLLINNVGAFSSIQFYKSATPSAVISIITKDNELLGYETFGNFSIEKALSSTPRELGENIQAAVPYNDGIAAINTNGDLVVYGKDFDLNNSYLSGENIDKNCKMITSSAESVKVVMYDGSMKCYGYMNDQTHHSFKSHK